MGRPPIGERALTAAEKMRRYRARKFGNKPPVTKSPVTNAAVASLQARLREVETELARERQAHKETRDVFGNKDAVTKSLERDRDRYKQKAEKAEARVAELEATQRRPSKVEREQLSLTDQQKLDAVIQQYKGRLGAEFDARVRERVRQKVDEIILPHWREKLEKAQVLYERRRGVMDKATFNLIWSALHPDSRKSISDAKLARAFDTFTSLEKHLLAKKDSPTHIEPLPDNLAAWDKMRTKPRRSTGKKTVVRA